MTAGPITTKLELAQCQKCSAYVFSSTVAGLTTAVDPAPLDGTAELTEALIAKREIFTAVTVNGKPYKLNRVPLPQMGRWAASGHPLYATHPCMAAGVVRASAVEVAPEGPQRAPVTSGGPQGGFRPAHALARGSQGHTAKIATVASSAPSPSHARRANPRPSRCVLCNKVITGDESNVVAIEYDGRIVWAYHVDD